jgi:hypothetical protein
MLTSCKSAALTDKVTDKITMHYFYNEACSSCDGASLFRDIVNAALKDVAQLYPYEIIEINTFTTDGEAAWDEFFTKLGFEEQAARFIVQPVLVVDGMIFPTLEYIGGSVREAYLAAGEDLIIYGKEPYDPTGSPTPKQLLSAYKVNAKTPTCFYFYRNGCGECGRVSDVIAGLPGDILRVNTFTDRNQDIARLFYTAYGVPDELQTIPAVFTAKGYYIGYDDITTRLPISMANGDGLNFKLPD